MSIFLWYCFSRNNIIFNCRVVSHLWMDHGLFPPVALGRSGKQDGKVERESDSQTWPSWPHSSAVKGELDWVGSPGLCSGCMPMARSLPFYSSRLPHLKSNRTGLDNLYGAFDLSDFTLVFSTLAQGSPRLLLTRLFLTDVTWAPESFNTPW